MQIRYMIRADLPQVIAIDAAAGEGWDEETFRVHLRKRNCIGMVADVNRVIVAFMLYELHKDSLELLRLVVQPEHQAMYVGTAMLDKLTSKLAQQRRQAITARVHERNLGAQKFLKSCGFRAVAFQRDEYENGDGAIGFEWRVGELGPETVIHRSDEHTVPG